MISNDILKKKILEKCLVTDFQNSKQNILSNYCVLDNGTKTKNVSLPYLDVKALRGQIDPTIKTDGIKISKGDFALLVDGENSGEVFQMPCEGYLGSTLKKLTFLNDVNETYVKYFIDLNKNLLKNNKTGSAIPHLNKKLFANLDIYVPPLEEQKDIVAKIEELFDLIDRKSQNDIEKEKLKEVLKERILDSAIHGTLVENDLSLKPVEVESIEENIPFEIPINWKWCKYQNIGISNIGLTYSLDNVCDDGIIVLRSSNIQNGKIDFKDIVRVNSKINDNLYVKENDILVCARNGSKRLVGKSCLIENSKERMTYGAFMTIFRTNFYKYVYWFMQSKNYYNQLSENTNTMTINQITQKKLNSLILPLPPIEEQYRIVEKIEECFKLIEQL